MTWVSIDGTLVPADEARISIFDRGFLYGDGVFEVFRTWGGVTVDLGPHLDRLYASARWLELHTPERAALEAAVERTIVAAGGGDYRVRVVLTRGPGSLAARPRELGPGRSIVIVEPLPALPATVSLAVVDWPLPRRPEPGHKTLAYLDHLIARELAVRAGADEAVRLDADGHVVECATANLFMVGAAGVVFTPPLHGGLPGVTRAHVMAACAEAEIPLQEAPMTPNDLRRSYEIFITSAVRGVVPVTQLDGQPRERGPVTARISTLYARRVRPRS